MGAVDEFNSLAFERLELAATYTDLSLQLEKLLEEVRSETSRARSINGLTLTAAAGPGATDLEPYTRVNVSGDDFSLQDFEASEEGDSQVRKRTSTKGTSDEERKEKTDEKKQGLPQGAFRPFGILEPNSAKLARKEAAHSLALCCELAGIRARICRVDERLAEVARNTDSAVVKQFKQLKL